jgi:hypothetical protein
MDLIASLCDKIRKGNSLKNACRLCGLPWSTFQLWMRRGRGDDATHKAHELHITLVAMVEEARAIATERMVDCVVEQARKDWRAAAWYLEKCAPDEFRNVQELHVVAPQEMDDATLAEQVEEIRKSMLPGQPQLTDGDDGDSD